MVCLLLEVVTMVPPLLTKDSLLACDSTRNHVDLKAMVFKDMG